MKYSAMNKANEHSDLGMGGGGGGGGRSVTEAAVAKSHSLEEENHCHNGSAIISNRRQALALEVEVLRRISLHWVIKTASKRPSSHSLWSLGAADHL